MVVPHLFTPEWAGGHRWFTGANPYKGSIAWYTMNFWWDYLYSESSRRPLPGLGTATATGVFCTD